jgi:hypothetical protein
MKSAYPIGETIERLKKDIAGKGIKFFDEIDQSKLAADAGITGRNSSRQTPMRDSIGRCGFSSMKTRKARCAAYTEFDWIARRHGIENRNDQFNMASSVITSITSSVEAK